MARRENAARVGRLLVKLRTDSDPLLTGLLALAGWALTALGIWMFWMEIGHWDGRTTAAAVMLVLFGSPFGVVCTLIVIYGNAFLKIDVRAGTAKFVQAGRAKWTVPLSDLALSIHQRGQLFHLETAGRGGKLFTATTREAVRERMHLIERLQAQSAIRKILALTVEGAEFRGAPDILSQARQVVPDGATLRAAVSALREDADVDVRTRADELWKALDRG